MIIGYLEPWGKPFECYVLWGFGCAVDWLPDSLEGAGDFAGRK